MPFWLNALGGYTQLGTLVLVMALAATALNFLLGYTGVLSFGHAAYFGLGAYGAGLTIKYLVPSTLLGMAGRRRRGDAPRRRSSGADRPSARHLFRHGDDRLRPGLLFHRLPLEQRDRRRRRTVELEPQADRFRLWPGSTSSAAPRLSIISCCSSSRSRSRRWRRRCGRPSAARFWRSAKTSDARAFSAFRSTTISGCRG